MTDFIARYTRSEPAPRVLDCPFHPSDRLKLDKTARPFYQTWLLGADGGRRNRTAGQGARGRTAECTQTGSNPPRTCPPRALPLAGVTVLDLGRIYNGPYAAFLMAARGARRGSRILTS
jgi:hypothetical protein